MEGVKMLSFGIKEARRAEEFAKTQEQKETVLAVVRMMNIPIVVNKQASKQAKKLESKIAYTNGMIERFQSKVNQAQAILNNEVAEKTGISETSVNWSI